MHSQPPTSSFFNGYLCSIPIPLLVYLCDDGEVAHTPQPLSSITCPTWSPQVCAHAAVDPSSAPLVKESERYLRDMLAISRSESSSDFFFCHSI